MNDLEIAKRYVTKSIQASEQGNAFELSFSEFARLMKTKRCKYIGIELTTKKSGKDIRATDRTLERFDNSLGYVKGNVFAVCHYANKLKSTLENPSNEFTIEHLAKMVKFVMAQEKARQA